MKGWCITLILLWSFFLWTNGTWSGFCYLVWLRFLLLYLNLVVGFLCILNCSLCLYFIHFCSISFSNTNISVFNTSSSCVCFEFYVATFLDEGFHYLWGYQGFIGNWNVGSRCSWLLPKFLQLGLWFYYCFLFFNFSLLAPCQGHLIFCDIWEIYFNYIKIRLVHGSFEGELFVLESSSTSEPPIVEISTEVSSFYCSSFSISSTWSTSRPSIYFDEMKRLESSGLSMVPSYFLTHLVCCWLYFFHRYFLWWLFSLKYSSECWRSWSSFYLSGSPILCV